MSGKSKLAIVGLFGHIPIGHSTHISNILAENGLKNEDAIIVNTRQDCLPEIENLLAHLGAGSVNADHILAKTTLSHGANMHNPELSSFPLKIVIKPHPIAVLHETLICSTYNFKTGHQRESVPSRMSHKRTNKKRK